MACYGLLPVLTHLVLVRDSMVTLRKPRALCLVHVYRIGKSVVYVVSTASTRCAHTMYTSPLLCTPAPGYLVVAARSDVAH